MPPLYKKTTCCNEIDVLLRNMLTYLETYNTSFAVNSRLCGPEKCLFATNKQNISVHHELRAAAVECQNY